MKTRNKKNTIAKVFDIYTLDLDFSEIRNVISSEALTALKDHGQTPARIYLVAT